MTYSLLMELLFSSEFRTFAGCVSEGFWALGIMALAVMAKYVQHWRYIQLAINIPTVSTIFYIWIIPESVRWLLSRGKVHRAEKIVCRIASCNGVRVEGGRVRQVWSLTQFYYVDFSKSRIGVNKCVLYKRTIKVCVSCC